MKGLEPFRTWDETYVHSQAQREGPPRPPGPRRGRRRGALDLGPHPGQGPGLLHGLRPRRADLGAARLPGPGRARASAGRPNKGEVFDSRPQVAAGLEAVRVRRAGAKIPNYLPGKQWGTQGEPITKMQLPLAPAESMKHMAVPARLRGELFAAEPEIAKPITMAWDHRGRLWIAETVDYPNDLQPDGQGPRPDQDLRGHRRRRPGRQVHRLRRQAEHPHQPGLRQRRRDRPPGARHPLPQGHRRRRQGRRPQGPLHRLGHAATPTPARATSATGFDNWLYGIVGYSGFRRHGRRRAAPVPPGLLPVQARRLEARVPPQHEQQLLGRRLQRGRARLRLDGQRLPERLPADPQPLLRVGPRLVAAACSRTSPTRTGSSRSPTRSARSTGTAASPPRPATPSTPRGPIPSTTGTAPRSSPSRPATWSPPSRSSRKGSDFASHNAWNLLASDDEWTSPIAAEVGPDGNVWVIDWYNFIVQHNPTPEGFKTGKGTAYETPLRDKTHGRIYRIVYQDGEAVEPDRASTRATRRALVAALEERQPCSGGCTPSGCWSSGASRTSCPALIELVRDRSVDAIGLNPAAIHALWTLHGLGRSTARDPTRDDGGRRGAEASLGRGPAERGAGPAARTTSGDGDPRRRAARRPRPAGPPGGVPGPGRPAGLGRRRRPRVAAALRRRPGRRRPLARRRRHRRRGRATTAAFLKAIAGREARQAGRRADGRSAIVAPGRRALRPGRPGRLGRRRCSPRSPDADRASPRRSSPAWPAAGRRTSTAELDDADEKALVAAARQALARGAAGQLVEPGRPLGRRGAREVFAPRSPRRCWRPSSDERKPDAARIDAARQLVEFRPATPRRRRRCST